ncbi:hypothetical protein EJ419_02790 [Alloscardovia theropitheci]|uniref:Type II secretion system protein GspF domain-containing protein n=1 Tax=Alloscardovia theropitheci TaxID=2496842 RepID=A0A4R0QQG1_9BIFI|nr:hypothetical protein [Alloscardovia theropitheci]TCD54543.1 hypothetical protein EJ419_02790 [Alloscardovia theropitheci]
MMQTFVQLGYRPHASVCLTMYTIQSLISTLIDYKDFHVSSQLISRSYLGVSSSEMEKRFFAMRLYSACKLSEISGCSAITCLEILHEDVKRVAMRNQQKAEATAVARMTIRILLVLPVLTLIVSWISGVQSFSFLFATLPGWVCLISTAFLYGSGLIWSYALLQAFERSTQVQSD